LTAGTASAPSGPKPPSFLKQTGVDYEDALGDLLGDLMHLADREPFDFEPALGRARGHYAAETGSAPY
jgi:hypothetical protein